MSEAFPLAVPDRPVASTAPISKQGRLEFQPPRVMTRQAAWTLAAGATGALLHTLGLLDGGFGLVPFAVTSAVGLAVAYPAQLLRSLHLVVGLLFVGFMAQAIGLSADLWAAGLVGAVATWYTRERFEPWRLINGALGSMIGAGLAGFMLQPLVWNAYPVVVAMVTAALIAFGVSQTLWLDGLTWHRLDAIPSRRKIRRTLGPRYREPCLKAWHIDGNIRGLSPDRETKEGLMEVAAWVYRLSWALQALDKELGVSDEMDLAQRISTLEQRAAADSDPFVRDRRLATARHLDQTRGHRRALALERERTSALLEYALAFLEEARAGLAVARIQPGGSIPDRLDDVLLRLRSYAKDRSAERTTAHEVSGL